MARSEKPSPESSAAATRRGGRVERAPLQDAALRRLDKAELEPARKMDQGYAPVADAVRIRRAALIDARDVGIPSRRSRSVCISVARASQLLGNADEPHDKEVTR